VADAEAVLAFASQHGYPVAIKAAGGGGGRGLKVARNPQDVPAAFEAAVREAEAYFGYGDVYLERYLEHPKHIEVQVLAEVPGRAMWLGARDCSLQRRHQKLVEETPPARFGDLVPDMGRAAVAVADACGYVNAGTVEFLVDTGDGRFYFLDSGSARTTSFREAVRDRAATPSNAGSTRKIRRADSSLGPAGSSAIGNPAGPASGWTPGSGRATRSRASTTAWSPSSCRGARPARSPAGG